MIWFEDKLQVLDKVASIFYLLLLFSILILMSLVRYRKTAKLEKETWLNLILLTILVLLVSTTEVLLGWVFKPTSCGYIAYSVTAVENIILFNLSIVLAHKAHLVCKDIHDFAFTG